MDTAQTSISPEGAAVAFYGIGPIGGDGNEVERFYRIVTEWFHDRGCPPDKIAVRGPGHSGKYVRFSYGAARLKRLGFGGVTTLEMVASASGASAKDGDYMIVAAYKGEPDSRSMCSIVARTSIAPLAHVSMLPLARSIVEACAPAYGIGFTRELKYGPEYYVFGIGSGRKDRADDPEAGTQIALWISAEEEEVWNQGLLRNVYRWNFLTHAHLTRQIGDQSLEMWVRQDARRGTLLPVTDKVTLWEVSPPDLNEVRRAMWDAGAIYRIS